MILVLVDVFYLSMNLVFLYISFDVHLHLLSLSQTHWSKINYWNGFECEKVVEIAWITRYTQAYCWINVNNNVDDNTANNKRWQRHITQQIQTKHQTQRPKKWSTKWLKTLLISMVMVIVKVNVERRLFVRWYWFWWNGHQNSCQLFSLFFCWCCCCWTKPMLFKCLTVCDRWMCGSISTLCFLSSASVFACAVLKYILYMRRNW